MEWNGVCDAFPTASLCFLLLGTFFFFFFSALSGGRRWFHFPVFLILSCDLTLFVLFLFPPDSERRRRAYLLVRICLFPGGHFGKCGWHMSDDEICGRFVLLACFFFSFSEGNGNEGNHRILVVKNHFFRFTSVHCELWYLIFV